MHSAAHFAERHQLILIVALGESLVAIGVGVSDQPVSVPVVAAADLRGRTGGGAVVAVLRRGRPRRRAGAGADASGEERTRLARDSYTYLHFPIVISIIYIALGLKKVLEYVADTDHHDLVRRRSPAHRWSRCTAASRSTCSAMSRSAAATSAPGTRTARSPLRPAAALLPVAWRVPAIAALGLVAAVLVALVAYELVRFGAARERVRHHEPG